MDLKNLRKYEIDFPKVWTFLYSPEEADSISNEHKDQIHFLNEEGTELVANYLTGSKMTYGCDPNAYDGKEWVPFNNNYFKSVIEFKIYEDDDKELKKWLYNLEIPFDKYVILDQDTCGKSVLLTWKMVIKYHEGLFFAEDLVIFDETLDWALFYFHESHLFFGRGNIFDREKEEQKTIIMNDILRNIEQTNNEN